DELRQQPEVITRFFGEEAARRFCGKVVLQQQWPAAYHRQRVSDRVIENYSVRLDMFWPAERCPGVSAAFSFSRVDLSGISLAIDGATLVSWMQWTAHAEPAQEMPFLPGAPGGSKFVLMAPTARLQLTRSEMEDVRWVLREAWQKYIAAAERLDESWQASRFPVRRSGPDERFFPLCRVELWFWRAVLAYAAEHDFTQGDSPQHIFDGGAGCLKVYVGEPRAGLQPGYHLIAYGFADDSHALMEGGVVIVWQSFRGPGGQAPVYARDRAWDAEYTHGWLMGTLFPAVLAWVKDRQRRPVSPLSRWRERLAGSRGRSRSGSGEI